MDSNFILQLGFSNLRDVIGRYSVADLFPSKRTGIYLLHFPDDTYYVGQAIDVVRRFAQHKRRFCEISRIAFMKVARSRLNEVEKECIAMLEGKCTLRNIALVSSPVQKSDLDDVISRDEQVLWLKTDFQEAKCRIPVQDEVLRAKYHEKFEFMKQNPQALQFFFPVIREYLKYCIPEPFKTGISFWGCSCNPSYRNGRIHIFSRINIWWQEVFTVFYNKDSAKYGYSFHTTKSDLTDSIIMGLRKKCKTFEINEHRYTPGGADQCNPCCYAVDEVIGLLHEPAFVYAIKNFNLRNMRKGPEMYSRYHCIDLANFSLETESGL